MENSIKKPRMGLEAKKAFRKALNMNTYLEPVLCFPDEYTKSFDARLDCTQKILNRILPEKLVETLEGLGPKMTQAQFKIELEKILPLIDIVTSRDKSGFICISAFTPSEPFRGNATLFSLLTSDRLVPGKHLKIVSSQSIQFRFHVVKDTIFSLHQVTLEIPLDDLPEAEKNLNLLRKELELHTRCSEYTECISHLKGCVFDPKAIEAHHLLVQLTERFNRFFQKDLLKVIFWQSAFFPKNFENPRSSRHLARILATMHVLYEKTCARCIEFPNERHVVIRLFPAELNFPFGKRPALGIIVAVNKLQKRELFSDAHIMKGVVTFFPNAQFIPDSYVAFHPNNAAIKLLYLEIEKGDATSFNRMDIAALRKGLAGELKMRVERLIHPVFMPRSDEALFNHITKLSCELQEITDIPQVMISFDRQEAESLIFSVVLVRVLKPEDPSLEQMLKNSGKWCEHKFHRVKIVGHLRDIYPKEANVLSTLVDKTLFLRKNGSIDLFKARQFVVENLTRVTGDIRDVNGGMILKQGELFSSLKTLLQDLSPADEFLLENFFYSISPIAMQGILPPSPLRQWFALVQEAIKNRALGSKKDELSSCFDGQHCMLVIASSNPNLKDYISTNIEQVALSDLDMASASIEFDGTYYFAYIYRHHDPSRQRLFINTAKEALNNWSLRSAQKQVLKLNMPYGIGPLDPRIGGDQQSGIVKRMLYDGLMRLNKEGAPTFAIAHSVDVSEDGLIYTFSLREATWSNKDPILAYDFEYAWKKVLDPGFQTPFAYAFFMIKNAKCANEGLCSIDDVGVKALDDTTLQVKLEHPAPYFLALTAHWTYFPVSSKSDSSHPGWAYSAADAYISCGPFKLSKYDYGSKLELVPNPLYWDASSVKLEMIKIFIIPDNNVSMKMYENDELDWIGQPFSVLPINKIYELKKEGKLLSTPIAATSWLEFNVESFPFNNKKMRQALNYAINREKLTSEIVPGKTKPATSVLPLNLELQKEPYFKDNNISLAKQLFEEALEEVNLSRDKFPSVSILCSASDLTSLLIDAIIDQWEEVFGIKITKTAYEWDEFFTHRSNNFFQISLLTWYCWYSDPSYVLDLFKYRSNALNSTQWENPKYTALLNEAENTLNPEKRLALFHKAEVLLIEESPVIPLYHDGDSYLKKDRLKGFTISQTGDVDFKEAYMERL